jgi:hypothetical protein
MKQTYNPIQTVVDIELENAIESSENPFEESELSCRNDIQDPQFDIDLLFDF